MFRLSKSSLSAHKQAVEVIAANFHKNDLMLMRRHRTLYKTGPLMMSTDDNILNDWKAIAQGFHMTAHQHAGQSGKGVTPERYKSHLTYACRMLIDRYDEVLAGGSVDLISPRDMLLRGSEHVRSRESSASTQERTETMRRLRDAEMEVGTAMNTAERVLGEVALKADIWSLKEDKGLELIKSVSSGGRSTAEDASGATASLQQPLLDAATTLQLAVAKVSQLTKADHAFQTAPQLVRRLRLLANILETYDRLKRVVSKKESKTFNALECMQLLELAFITDGSSILEIPNKAVSRAEALEQFLEMFRENLSASSIAVVEDLKAMNETKTRTPHLDRVVRHHKRIRSEFMTSVRAVPQSSINKLVVEIGVKEEEKGISTPVAVVDRTARLIPSPPRQRPPKEVRKANREKARKVKKEKKSKKEPKKKAKKEKKSKKAKKKSSKKGKK